MDDIEILVDTINNSTETQAETQAETQTELEIAKSQILITIQPKIQMTTIDELDLSKDKKSTEKAMDIYKRAVREKKEIEFNKRLSSRGFRQSIRDGVGKVKVDSTLSNRPNKKR